MPQRKKKCPHCGDFIFVRKRPLDDRRVLLTEAQAEQLGEERERERASRVWYHVTPGDFEKERAALSKKFGMRASDRDVLWSILNRDNVQAMRASDWGSYTHIREKMAEILALESKGKEALAAYLEICFLELNWGSLHPDPDLDGFEDVVGDRSRLNHMIVTEIDELVEKLALSRSEVKRLFIDQAKRYAGMRLKKSPTRAWGELSEELPDLK